MITTLISHHSNLDFLRTETVKNLAHCSVVICQMPSKIERDIVIDWIVEDKKAIRNSVTPSLLFLHYFFYKVCYVDMSGFISIVVDAYKNLNKLC